MPIDRLTDEEFKKLQNELYNLSDQKLVKIKELYNIGKREGARIDCDEMHMHNSNCILYHNRHTAIVEALVGEINRYKSKS